MSSNRLSDPARPNDKGRKTIGQHNDERKTKARSYRSGRVGLRVSVRVILRRCSNV